MGNEEKQLLPHSIDNKEKYLQSPKNRLNKLQCFLSAVAISLLLTLGTPNQMSAQTKQLQNKELNKDTLEKKEMVTEQMKINKLKQAFKTGPYGSDHFIGMLGGNFVGEHGETKYNERQLTSAYDYLTLDNTFLTLLVNLGYTEDNIKFISTKKLPNTKSYKLGYVTFKEINKNSEEFDSLYTTQSKKLALTKSYFKKFDYYKADTTHKAIVNLGGGKHKKQEKGEEGVVITTMLPQIDGTGSWENANDFDLAYERTEMFFEQNKDNFDIQKREFSKYTPKEVQEIILYHFDKQHQSKSTTKKQEKWDETGIDAECLDLIRKPDMTKFTINNYEFFRYGVDVYYRDIKKNQGDKNPKFNSAYQDSNEKQKEFICLSYGTKDHSMPTEIPSNLPAFGTYKNRVLYSKGAASTGHAIDENLQINKINGKLIDQNYYEYPSEKGIIYFNNGQGVVDHTYKIWNRADKEINRGFISSGKLCEVKIENILTAKKTVNRQQTRRFVEYEEYNDFIESESTFIKKLEDLADTTDDNKNKISPIVHMKITVANPKKPKKQIKKNKEIKFNPDHTAIIYPDAVFAGREIVNEGNNKHINITVLGKTINFNTVETTLESSAFTETDKEEIEINNEKYKKTQEAFLQKISNLVTNTSELYKEKIYDLTDLEESSLLIETIIRDISNIDYTIGTTKGNINYEKNKTANDLATKIKNMEQLGNIESNEYKIAKKQYNDISSVIQQREQTINNGENNKKKLIGLLPIYYKAYVLNLEKELKVIYEKQANGKKSKEQMEKKINEMERNGTTKTKEYEQAKQTLKYQEKEEKETQEKIEKIEKEIKDTKEIIENKQ